MSQNFPPLVWLRAFEATARHLSFTHAATELLLSQAAVSKQVKLLEQHLNEPLFIRRVRALELTKAGESYLPKVSDAFERLEAGTDEVFGKRDANVLTIRCTTVFSVNWLAKRLPDFQQKHPDIQLRIISNIWNENVKTENFDIDIRYGTGSFPNARSDRLTEENLIPLCSKAMIDNGELRTVEDLSGKTLIHILGYQDGWARWLKTAGHPDLNANYTQVDSTLLAYQLAASGYGIALAWQSVSKEEIESGRLVQPFELVAPIKEAFYLLTPHELTPHADVFRNWILEHAEQSNR